MAQGLLDDRFDRHVPDQVGVGDGRVDGGQLNVTQALCPQLLVQTVCQPTHTTLRRPVDRDRGHTEW